MTNPYYIDGQRLSALDLLTTSTASGSVVGLAPFTCGPCKCSKTAHLTNVHLFSSEACKALVPAPLVAKMPNARVRSSSKILIFNIYVYI
jgi:hypothetical protein